MQLGYNTLGLQHHHPLQAVELLADVGYQSVAVALSRSQLHPDHPQYESLVEELGARLEIRQLSSVVAVQTPYLIEPTTPFEPSLISRQAEQRAMRVELLKQAIDLAGSLQSRCVITSTGPAETAEPDEVLLERLGESLGQVLEYADDKNVSVALEPRRGQFVDTTARFERLLQWADSPRLALSLHVGHMFAQSELPIAEYVTRLGPRTASVHLHDRRAGEDQPRMFGQGQMSFAPILEAFVDVGFQGGLHVDLPHFSDWGVEAARQAYEFLEGLGARG